MCIDDNVLYWAEKLQENSDELRPLIRKMYDKMDSLSYEELYRLRGLLEQNASFVRLLNEDLDQPEPEPRSLWKKLFRK